MVRIRIVGRVRGGKLLDEVADSGGSGGLECGWSEMRHRDSVRAGAGKQVEVGTVGSCGTLAG